MRWRDVRFEKPTQADANKDGKILQLLSSGGVVSWMWDVHNGVVAWCPMSELPKFDRVPDPPEGWRFVRKGEAFNSQKARIWFKGDWVAMPAVCYGEQATPIVPIDLPKPKYRPFASAAEFEPYALRFWRFKTDTSGYHRPPCAFGDVSHATDSWENSLECKVFADGSPFGVEVTE